MNAANPSASPPDDRLAAFLDEMIAARNAVCQEHALTINHKHCIGCVLVADYMKNNHPNLQYGTQDQWVEEAAFCALHERKMFMDFLKARGTKP